MYGECLLLNQLQPNLSTLKYEEEYVHSALISFSPLFA